VTATNGADSAGFDLAGYRAAHAEATHKTFPVKLGAHEDEAGNVVVDVIEFPEQRQWSLDAQDKFAQGDVVGGFEILLGPEQWALFHSYDWRFGEVEALFEAVAKWSGFEMGQGSSPPRVRALTPRSS
jgi:hypothetical protein